MLKCRFHVKNIDAILPEHNWIDIDAHEITLPQIEEVLIFPNNKVSLSFVVMQLVGHWISLKRILVPAAYDVEIAFPIADFNRARERLENACALTIYTNNKDSATNLDHKFVKLKFVEMKVDLDLFEYQMVSE